MLQHLTSENACTYQNNTNQTGLLYLLDKLD